jgi:hypothetical protein
MFRMRMSAAFAPKLTKSIGEFIFFSQHLTKLDRGVIAQTVPLIPATIPPPARETDAAAMGHVRGVHACGCDRSVLAVSQAQSSARDARAIRRARILHHRRRQRGAATIESAAVDGSLGCSAKQLH